MTAESPAQTVQRLFPLLAEGKTADAAALFADSVSFSIPHPPGIPWVPEVDSAEGMRTFFELLGTHVQPKEFDLRQVIAEGDDVVLIGRMVSEVKKTGRDIDTAFALHTRSGTDASPGTTSTRTLTPSPRRTSTTDRPAGTIRFRQGLDPDVGMSPRAQLRRSPFPRRLAAPNR